MSAPTFSAATRKELQSYLEAANSFAAFHGGQLPADTQGFMEAVRLLLTGGAEEVSALETVEVNKLSRGDGQQSAEPDVATPTVEDPNYGGTTADKIHYAIKSLDRFVHRSEIEAFMREREGDISVNTLSYTISTMFKQKGELIRARYNEASHMIFYGSPHMVHLSIDGRLLLDDRDALKYLRFADEIYRPQGEAVEHADRRTLRFEYEGDSLLKYLGITA
ncbi:MAG: hypothetical protein AAFP18_03535 [Bacteroidota bacterium]